LSPEDLASRNLRSWHVRHLLEPICQQGRLPGLSDEAEYVNLLRSSGFAMSSVEDISGAVARTWSVCVQRAVYKLATDSRYRQRLLPIICHHAVLPAVNLPH
jgi:tocopherol O-methyltransferase